MASVWVVFVLAIPSNSTTVMVAFLRCGLYLFQQYPQTRVYFVIQKLCVGCICFSNTLKLVVCFQTRIWCVGCICFSNTLKHPLQAQAGQTSVGCICFSNTLKRYCGCDYQGGVWVVFVLAIPSNCCLVQAIPKPVWVVFVLAIPSNTL